jgi:thiol-disulfide isomerase/thioredoxin
MGTQREGTVHRLVPALTCLCLGACTVFADTGPTEDVVAVQKLMQSDMELQVAIIEATTNDEKEHLRSELAAKRKQLPRDLLELARKYPMTTGELAALYWASFLSADSEVSKTAAQRFQKRALGADLEQLVAAIRLGRRGGNESGGNEDIARLLLSRARANPTDGTAAELLTCVCRLADTDHVGPHSNRSYSEAADLIAAQHADSADITNFCETLGNGAGGLDFVRHLKAIFNVNKHRDVRCAASFAMASVIERSPEDRQREAAQLYRDFLDSFDGNHQYHFQSVEHLFRQRAAAALSALELIGMPALGTIGEDLAGKRIVLADYKGQVVLLSFWASWCTPCMKMIPHERELATQYKDKAFAIVGVNGDPDVKEAQHAAEVQGITWRSFRDHHGDGAKISEIWKVSGWPTMYLIDDHGIVRRCWRAETAPEELSAAIADLVDQTSTAR